MLTLDIPKITFFESKNIYTGSQGRFRYRIWAEEGELKACIYEDLCFEKAEVTAEQQFPLTQDGIEQVKDWLQQQYKD